jgi:hypothetical protein
VAQSSTFEQDYGANRPPAGTAVLIKKVICFPSISEGIFLFLLSL